MKKLSLILVLALVMSFVIIPATASAATSGTGTGLSAKYYNSKDLSGNTVINRIDQTINFDWGYNSPGNNINSDSFSVEWIGQIQPLYSEEYTFYTTSDDGVRLWIDGQQIINNWVGHSVTEDSGKITLKAGQKYDIKLQYFDSAEAARISLSWKSNSQTKQIIPKTQLYPKMVLLAGDNSFDYAIFSDNNITFNGSKNYVEGSAHANDSFTANGGLTVTENVEAKSFTLNGKNDFGEKIITSDKIDINKVPGYITEQLKVNDPLNGDQNYHSSTVKLNKSIYINGSAVFDAPSFEGTGTIKTTGNITFNGSTHYNSGSDDVCFYTQNGNIIVNGSGSEIYGSLYAPNGSIIFNGSNVKVYGRVIGKYINLNGNISVYYRGNDKDSIENTTIRGEDGNSKAIAVRKDINGNTLDEKKAVIIKLDISSDVGKVKINLASSDNIKLPTEATVNNLSTGETFTANIQNGYITIDKTLKAGSYLISLDAAMDNDVSETDSITLKSVTTMDSNGKVCDEKQYNESVIVKTLPAQLTSTSKGTSIAAFKNSKTNLILDFVIKSENTTINDIDIAALNDKKASINIPYSFIKFVRIDSGNEKPVALNGKEFPANLSVGTYRVYLQATFDSSLSVGSQLIMYIKNIDITTSNASSLDFGPYDGTGNQVNIKIVAMPKMH